MNINNAFPSKYLKSGDITDEDMVLTISHVEIENVGQGGDTELKPIVYFTETDKGLVLNKTNAATIAKVVGTPETDGWPGKKIALFATEVDFQGKQTLALRVRIRAPARVTSLTDPIDALVERAEKFLVAMNADPTKPIAPQTADRLREAWEQVWGKSEELGLGLEPLKGSPTPLMYADGISRVGKAVIAKQTDNLPF